ncbi:MAG: hypothetical protein A2Y02_01435 [Omnitrophica bacterium GWA2_52_12]|nr:MAG: hypothetical protein A2Y02_01435 [Omnitrophica bacterium GWA2_52_12]
MFKKVNFPAACFLAGFVFFSHLPCVRADFKLMDAIEEFGEKRFVKPTPTRLKAGPFRLHPSLRSSSTFDSNILLEHEDPRGDVVFNIQPGAIIELPIDKHQLAAGYEADFEIFSKSRDHRQNDQNQNFFSLLDLNFPSWYVNVLERFSETSGRSGTTFTSRIPRYDQSIQPKAGYRWKRFTFETGFRHVVRDFRQQVNDALDFQEVGFSGVIYYDLFARLKALVEYQLSQIDYDDDFTRKGTFNQSRIGFDGEPVRNLKVKARLGMQFRNYQVSSEPDFYSWVGSVWAEYQIRLNLKLTLEAAREPVEATFQNVNFYREHRLGLGVEYSPWRRWTLFSRWDYIRDGYAERATLDGSTRFRRDSHYNGRYGIRYGLTEWLRLELAYDHLNRRSNFSSLSYVDHRVSLASVLSY